MPRRTHPKRSPIEDRFDTDVCSLPRHPHIDRIIVVPLKTIFRNMDAAPWGADVVTIRSYEDPLLDLIQQQL